MPWDPEDFLPYREDLGPTWWIMDSDEGMDDIADQAGDSLQDMVKNLQINPFQTLAGTDRLFLARFEFPIYGADFHYQEAVFVNQQPVSGFIDFLAGFPIEDKGVPAVEMLMAIGQYSTTPDKVTAVPGDDKVVAPVPETFFQWPDKDKILLNLTSLVAANFDQVTQQNVTGVPAQILAKNLNGQPAPTKPHWWFRINMPASDASGNPPKWPVPGELLALGVRMMPDVCWGTQSQLSSSFMYAGHWMDTVFYTSGVVTEVIDPTVDTPYPTYKVKWRVTDANSDGIVTATPSDFATYQVGDRVTILKDVTTTKTSQLWSDDDMKAFGDTWQIVPISFYELDNPAGG
jgi:hypothetical protein